MKIMHLSFATIVFISCIGHTVANASCWCRPTTSRQRFSQDADGRVFKGGFKIPLVKDIEDWELRLQFNSPVKRVTMTGGNARSNIEARCDSPSGCREFKMEAKYSEEVIPRGESLEIEFNARGFKGEDLNFKVELDGNDCSCLKSQAEEDSTLSLGVIVGLVMCVILLIVATVLLLVCLVVVRKHFRDKNRSASVPISNTYLTNSDTTGPTAYHQNDDQSVYQEIPHSEYSYAYADKADLSTDHSFQHGSKDNLINNSEDGEGWVKNIVYVSSDDTGAAATETETATLQESIYDSAINLNGVNQTQTLTNISSEEQTNEYKTDTICAKIIETSGEYSTVIRNTDNKLTSEAPTKAPTLENHGWEDNVIYDKQRDPEYIDVLPNIPNEKEQGSKTTTDTIKQDGGGLVDNIDCYVDESNGNLGDSLCKSKTADKNEAEVTGSNCMPGEQNDPEYLTDLSNVNTENGQNSETIDTSQKQSNQDCVVDVSNANPDDGSPCKKNTIDKDKVGVTCLNDRASEQNDTEYLTILPNINTEKGQNSETTTNSPQRQENQNLNDNVDQSDNAPDGSPCKSNMIDNNEVRVTGVIGIACEQRDPEHLVILPNTETEQEKNHITTTDTPQQQANHVMVDNVLDEGPDDSTHKPNTDENKDEDGEASLNDIQDQQSDEEYLTLWTNKNTEKEQNSATIINTPKQDNLDLVDNVEQSDRVPDGSLCTPNTDCNKKEDDVTYLHNIQNEQSGGEYLTLRPNKNIEREHNSATTTDIPRETTDNLVDNIGNDVAKPDDIPVGKPTDDNQKESGVTDVNDILDEQSDQEYLAIWPNTDKVNEHNSATSTDTQPEQESHGLDDNNENDIGQSNGCSDDRLCKPDTGDDKEECGATDLEDISHEQSDQEYLTIWSNKNTENNTTPT